MMMIMMMMIMIMMIMMIMMMMVMMYNLREWAYDRNPGDARMNVGSRRKFASLSNRRKSRRRRDRRKSRRHRDQVFSVIILREGNLQN